MKSLLKTFFPFLFLCHLSEAQDSSSLPKYHFELSGLIEYGYSDQRFPNYYVGSLDRFDQQHNVSVQPAVGYFLDSNFEILFEVSYGFDFRRNNNYIISITSTGEEEIREIVYSQWSHHVGFGLGPIFNLQTSQSSNLFFGCKINIAWTRRYLGFVDIDFGWKKPEYSFPSLIGGFRVFVAKNWAAIIRARYSHTTNYNGYDDLIIDTHGIGVGLAVYL